jgi:hypothetical protein
MIAFRKLLVTAAAVTTGAALALFTIAPSIANPPQIFHFAFTEADGSYSDPEWTNYFSFYSARTSSNLLDWDTNFPPLENRNGHLGFSETNYTPFGTFFCRATFTTNQ